MKIRKLDGDIDMKIRFRGKARYRWINGKWRVSRNTPILTRCYIVPELNFTHLYND